MSDIPKVGTKDELPPNDTATEQTGRNGLVTFYPTGTDQDRPAVITINGDNGGVDIGGTRDKHGKLLLRDKFMTITYTIDGELGETSQSGDIVLYDADGNERVRISGKTAEVILNNEDEAKVIHLDAKTGEMILGGGEKDGVMRIKNGDNAVTIRLDGGFGNLTLGGGDQDGDISIRNGLGAITIRLDGETGDVSADGTITAGELVVNGMTTTQDLTVNGTATAQDLVVSNMATIQDLTVNGTATAQDLVVSNMATTQDLTVNDAAAIEDLTVNGDTVTRDITVRNAGGDATIELDGNAGDIRLVAADCAEDFDVADAEDIKPGTVVVFDQEGKLRPSAKAYDRKIAGVISGAGDYRPGIVLDQQRASETSRLPVALMGKVYCKVDANGAPIGVGDLLTTAHTPGHAMKASDSFKAVGAVVGKALRPLESGTGLIPILVA